jgi:hypothetical protein
MPPTCEQPTIVVQRSLFAVPRNSILSHVMADRATSGTKSGAAVKRREEAARGNPRRLLRLAAGVAIALNVAPPTISLARAASVSPLSGFTGEVLLVVALVVPLHLRHVVAGVRGERPQAGWLTLGALSIVNVAALLILGEAWLINLALLAVSFLIVLPWRWGILVSGILVLGGGPLQAALAGSEPLFTGPYVVLSVAWNTATLFVPVWLVAEATRLEVARQHLRDQAVIRERLRIDGELRQGIGPALEEIVRVAELASAMVASDTAASVSLIESLIGLSRTALHDARRLVAGYQEVSIRAELDAGVRLLEASGARVRLIIDGDLRTADASSRAAVQTAVLRALRDESLRRCVIHVETNEAGTLRVGVLADPSPIHDGSAA